MAIITEEDVYGGSFTAFPAGLRVLVVDNDLNCLSCLVHLLQACHYQVTTCRGGMDALSVLRRSETKFDIVICDIYTPDIDGFKLLEIIQVEMDIPVVIMSKDDSRDVVMKVIFMGACDYLVKPVRKEEISVIWQHVVRKNSKAFMPPLLRSEINLSSDNYQNNNNNKSGEEHCGSSSGHMRSDEGSKNDIVSMKKQRMVWTTELHEQFVAAVNSIGLKCAVPKKILDLMKVPGLTRENVASHLQKYRSYIRRSMDNVGKKACNISSVQTRNVMHPYMMGSSTTTSVQVVAYPPSVTNQLHSQSSVVSQVEMDETERLSAAAGGVNGVPITYYNQSLCYGLQTPPPPPQTAVIHEEEQEILLSMEREQLSLNDENETIQFPLPFSSVIVDCGQSNNNQQQQQQQLGGYNLLNYYDRCSNDGIDQNPSFATVGNNSHYHSEYTFPFYDSVFLPQHYNNIQEGLTGN